MGEQGRRQVKKCADLDYVARPKGSTMHRVEKVAKGGKVAGGQAVPAKDAGIWPWLSLVAIYVPLSNALRTKLSFGAPLSFVPKLDGGTSVPRNDPSSGQTLPLPFFLIDGLPTLPTTTPLRSSFSAVIF
ncbi:uncharacterized protein VTP21DRAFT_3112 [Calcarisporiella thermophila]|uniref:uncharacterized protein n=1 Tax=Calcarisporiella thermophila TaxID=911321 RepID=UPI0037425B03